MHIESKDPSNRILIKTETELEQEYSDLFEDMISEAKVLADIVTQDSDAIPEGLIFSKEGKIYFDMLGDNYLVLDTDFDDIKDSIYCVQGTFDGETGNFTPESKHSHLDITLVLTARRFIQKQILPPETLEFINPEAVIVYIDEETGEVTSETISDY